MGIIVVFFIHRLIRCIPDERTVGDGPGQYVDPFSLARIAGMVKRGGSMDEGMAR